MPIASVLRGSIPLLLTTQNQQTTNAMTRLEVRQREATRKAERILLATGFGILLICAMTALAMQLIEAFKLF